MSITELIVEALKKGKNVELTGIGTIKTYGQQAYHDPATNIFYPSSQTVSFTTEETGDKTIVDLIGEEECVSGAVAQMMWNNYLAALTDKLHREGFHDLPTIGKLQYNGNVFSFEADSVKGAQNKPLENVKIYDTQDAPDPFAAFDETQPAMPHTNDSPQQTSHTVATSNHPNADGAALGSNGSHDRQEAQKTVAEDAPTPSNSEPIPVSEAPETHPIAKEPKGETATSVDKPETGQTPVPVDDAAEQHVSPSEHVNVSKSDNEDSPTEQSTPQPEQQETERLVREEEHPSGLPTPPPLPNQSVNEGDADDVIVPPPIPEAVKNSIEQQNRDTPSAHSEETVPAPDNSDDDITAGTQEAQPSVDEIFKGIGDNKDAGATNGEKKKGGKKGLLWVLLILLILLIAAGGYYYFAIYKPSHTDAAKAEKVLSADLGKEQTKEQNDTNINTVYDAESGIGDTDVTDSQPDAGSTTQQPIASTESPVVRCASVFTLNNDLVVLDNATRDKTMDAIKTMMSDYVSQFLSSRHYQSAAPSMMSRIETYAGQRLDELFDTNHFSVTRFFNNDDPVRDYLYNNIVDRKASRARATIQTELMDYGLLDDILNQMIDELGLQPTDVGAVAVSKPAPRKEAPAPAAYITTTSKKGFDIIAGSSTNKSTACRQAARLKALGCDAYVIDKNYLYFVSMGSAATQTAAEALRDHILSWYDGDVAIRKL